MFEKHIFGGLSCSVGWGMCAVWPSAHQKERWGGKGTVCMNAEQFLPWLRPVQSYQAGNSNSSWVCSSLGQCNQEEMKVPNCASRTILPLHRLLAFANEANSRSSPWIRSSAKTSHSPIVQHQGDKGSKEAHVGPVCSASLPQGIDTHWPAALSAESQQMLHTHPCALPQDSYGL